MAVALAQTDRKRGREEGQGEEERGGGKKREQRFSEVRDRIRFGMHLGECSQFWKKFAYRK